MPRQAEQLVTDDHRAPGPVHCFRPPTRRTHLPHRRKAIMLIKQLQKFGAGSDAMNTAGLGSIFVSILMWFRASDDAGRLSAIFVGLWAPTFFVLGSSMVTAEQVDRLKQAGDE